MSAPNGLAEGATAIAVDARFVFEAGSGSSHHVHAVSDGPAIGIAANSGVETRG